MDYALDLRRYRLPQSWGRTDALVALFLLLAWMPALAFAGHWSAPGSAAFDVAQDDVRFALVPQAHGAADPYHLYAATPTVSETDPATTTAPGTNPEQAERAHADYGHSDHGHGGAGATVAVAAIVPPPVELMATPVVVTAEPIADEPAVVARTETPPAPPPR